MRPLFIIFLFLFSSCATTQTSSKPAVLVSISPYAFFLKKIVGDQLQVRTIVPNGVDIHTYEPSARSLLSLEKVDIWFRIGDDFEEKIQTALLQKNPKIQVYDLRNTVPLIYTDHKCTHQHNQRGCGHKHHKCTHHHEENSRHFPNRSENKKKFADVHVWMNPKLALQQAKFMKDILDKKYPEISFEKNFSLLQQQLENLDQKIRGLLACPQSRCFITSHPSFAYFCKEYECTQISLEIEGKQALAKDVEQAVIEAKNQDVAVALIEPQFNPKSAKIVAQMLNIPVKMVDPYSENYIASLLRLAKVLNDPESA